MTNVYCKYILVNGKYVRMRIENNAFSLFSLVFLFLQDGVGLDICRAISKCEVEIANTYNWRLSALILSQLEILPRCIPSDLINSHFTPMVFNRALNAVSIETDH